MILVYNLVYNINIRFNGLMVGGLEHFSIYWEFHHPNWVSYFSEELKVPTSYDVLHFLYIILIVQLIVYDDLSEVNHWKWWVMLPKSPSGWETAFFLPRFFFSLRRHRQLFVSEPGPQMFGNGPNPSKSSWEGETWSILGGVLGDWIDLEAPKNMKTTWGDSWKIGSAVYRADG